SESHAHGHTLGGANSGKTSTGILRSCPVPKTSSATAAANTRNLNFRLEPMIQVNIPANPRHCYYELLICRAKCATPSTFLEPEHHSDFRRVSRRLLRHSDTHV